MSGNINSLYVFYRNNALLITKIRTIALDFIRQDYVRASRKFSSITQELESLSMYPEYYDKETLTSSLVNVISALDKKDYSLCADFLNSFVDHFMIPLQYNLFGELSEYISDLYDSIRISSDNAYVLEESAVGYPTLKSTKCSDRYLCSIEDPMYEATILAGEIFDPQYDSYIIYGLGLGYHIHALYEIANHSADIYVYETDPELIDIAKESRLGTWQKLFNEPRIHLIPDPDLLQLSQAIKNTDSKIYVYSPSHLSMPEDTEQNIKKKELLKKLMIKTESFDHYKKEILINFFRNTKNVTTYAEELFTEFEGRNAVIIAAGPSLDKNISELKDALKINDSLKVIAVGTVFRKLVSNGINPDAVCFMDPNTVMIRQIEGVENHTSKLILNTAAYYEIAEKYTGPKYLACQSGFELAEKSGHVLFETGGSVTTLAIDFAIRAKVKNIILLGCDMAYTGGVSHTKDTLQYQSTEENNVIKTKGYYGDTVYAGILLILYREWIEERFRKADVNDIGLYNATEGGAYIEGMQHISFKETIKLI